MLETLFYLFVLFFIVCGVVVLFGFYRNITGAAGPAACLPMSTICLPETPPPPCPPMLCPDADKR